MSTELAVTTGIVGSYFILYSSYDKKSATIKPEMLAKIFGFSNVTFSLREINKVLALAGLTVFGLSFAPAVVSLEADAASILQTHAASLLLAHGLYSTGSFYGFDPVKKYVENKRNLAIVMGDTALGLLFAETQYSSVSKAIDVSKENVLTASIILGTVHFYLMEITPGPFTGKLKVRPYGFVAFGASALALGIVGKQMFTAA
jgi:hypothetical protein